MRAKEKNTKRKRFIICVDGLNVGSAIGCGNTNPSSQGKIILLIDFQIPIVLVRSLCWSQLAKPKLLSWCHSSLVVLVSAHPC